MLKFFSRILFAIPVWLAYLLPMTLLVLLGFPIVGLATLLRAYKSNQDPDNMHRTHWRTRLLWLYDNDEDGIDGYATSGDGTVKNNAWARSTMYKTYLQTIFIWSAWRNSVGNARWLPFFGATIEPRDVVLYIPNLAQKRFFSNNTFTVWWNEYRKLGPYVARIGWKYELRFPWSATRFCWIGWRIAQCDVPTKAVGFAFQPFGRL